METDLSLKSPKGSVALIVGVTGMAGLSLAQALKQPAAPGSPWTVYGSSRRAPPAWFPAQTQLDLFVPLDALDSDGPARALRSLASHVTHLFWVALAARDTEEENIAANSAMLENVLRALTGVGGSRLRHVALQTGTKHYFGPFADPAQTHRLRPLEVPFREDTPRLPFPQFYYSLEDILASYSHKLTWSVHRSSLIFGASPRSIYNMVLTLVAYALICRHEGSPYVYPGTPYMWNHFCDASDSDLLAEQQIWAAATPAAAYQAFNCSNGDVFTWRSLWKVMSELFNVKFIECPSDPTGFDWVGRMKAKGSVWDAIVEKNWLFETRLEELTNFEGVYSVINFKFQHVCSMNKSREYGFYKSVDTLKSVRKWVERLREMNIIPID